MRTTFSISFYCRASKADKSGLSPIELGITINGSRKFINLPRKCDCKTFGYKRRPKDLEDYLSLMRSRINQICNEMVANGEPVTAEALREYVRSGGYKSYTVQDLFDDFFRILRKRAGVDLTMRAYDKSKLVETRFKEKVDFSREVTAITPALIQDFYADLKAKYQTSTVCGMLTKLKTIVKFGIDNGKIKVNPFQSIKISKGVKEIETITLSQLEAIRSHQFVPRVQKVADMFIFACGSGLSFADCIELEPKDFTVKDGKLCIFKERQKTGVKFYSVLLPWAVDIYTKYAGNFAKLKMSNQKTNMYLKEIQACCGIEMNLHFHLARHFYAMYLLNKKVPVTTVQRAIGHSQIAQTMHYAKALESTVVADIGSII